MSGVARKRAAVAVGTLVIAALAAEGFARLAEERIPSAVELDHFRRDEVARRFVVDPEFGFRPILGGPEYDERGLLRNRYDDAKAPGVRRVLFIGDSVTRRGRIVDAIHRLWGDEGFEYWNAGVESFNLEQTVDYFLRYACACDPDHVVFTFHFNDFLTTPVVYRESNGELAVWAPTRPRADVIQWLFHYSILYRRALARFDRAGGRRAIEASMRASLQQLKAWTEEHGVKLSVLVFPTLRPREEWYREETRCYETAIAMCRELGLETHGLLHPLLEALGDGVPVRQDPDDWIHPNEAAGDYFARYLHERWQL